MEVFESGITVYRFFGKEALVNYVEPYSFDFSYSALSLSIDDVLVALKFLWDIKMKDFYFVLVFWV